MLASSSKGSSSGGSSSDDSSSQESLGDGLRDKFRDRLSDAGTNDDEHAYYPTASETCIDNQMVFDQLVEYQKYGEIEFATQWLKLRGGMNNSESQEKQDTRTDLIAYQIFEQTEYNKICKDLKENIDAMRLDISHAQSDWVQDFYLNFLQGIIWYEQYWERFECAELDQYWDKFECEELDQSLDDNDDVDVSHWDDVGDDGGDDTGAGDDTICELNHSSPYTDLELHDAMKQMVLGVTGG